MTSNNSERGLVSPFFHIEIPVYWLQMLKLLRKEYQPNVKLVVARKVWNPRLYMLCPHTKLSLIWSCCLIGIKNKKIKGTNSFDIWRINPSTIWVALKTVVFFVGALTFTQILFHYPKNHWTLPKKEELVWLCFLQGPSWDLHFPPVTWFFPWFLGIRHGPVVHTTDAGNFEAGSLYLWRSFRFEFVCTTSSGEIRMEKIGGGVEGGDVVDVCWFLWFGLVWFGWVELVGWLVLVVCHLGGMDWIN